MGKSRTSKQDPESAGGNDTDGPLRGSREAMLGKDGLKPSTPFDTALAGAPDDERPSAYADSEPVEARADGEYGSREASLGGSAEVAHPAGALAPEDEALPHGARPGDPDPERDWASDVKKK